MNNALKNLKPAVAFMCCVGLAMVAAGFFGLQSPEKAQQIFGYEVKAVINMSWTLIAFGAAIVLTPVFKKDKNGKLK